MAVLGLCRRSPHHLPPPAAGLTPGELRLIARECADGGSGRVLAVAPPPRPPARRGAAAGEATRPCGGNRDHGPTRADDRAEGSRIDIRLKRAYDPARRADGYRVLVDRIWPRGLSREDARIDEWARDLAPSDSVRRWYGHDPERFEEFRRRYIQEFVGRRHRLTELRRRARDGPLTLVFAARDAEHSNAAVLASVLRGGLR
ncbi:MAG: DUF488 family protein [Thermoleophilaceae bacterium]|nr:DUF488 family protein [Thermoleophilaceae bacterium]